MSSTVVIFICRLNLRDCVTDFVIITIIFKSMYLTKGGCKFHDNWFGRCLMKIIMLCRIDQCIHPKHINV